MDINIKSVRISPINTNILMICKSNLNKVSPEGLQSKILFNIQTSSLKI